MKSGFSSFSSTLVAAIVAALLVSCSPEPVSRKFKDVNQNFGPSREDGIINMAEVKMESLPQASSVRWKGDIETASWYRAAEDLGWLSRTVKAPALGRMALRMHRSVARKDVAWSHSVRNSAFASAAIGETRSDTKKAVNSGVAMLSSQDTLIKEILRFRSEKTAWPTERTSLVSLVGLIDTFLVDFVRDVEKSQVDRAVKTELIRELRVNFGPKLKRIRAQFALAYNEPKAYDFVAKIRQVLKQEGVELGREIDQQLDLAERLPREVERIRDAKSALSVLVDFWLVSSTKVRETKFKKMAPDLYDFFISQTAEELECVKTGCGFFTRIKRALFILPEVEKFGIAKIRNLLAAAAEESIRSELENEAVKFLPKFHEEVYAQIRDELQRQKATITEIVDDYGKYMRVVLDRMAVSRLGVKEKDTISGVEPTQIRVDLDFSIPSERLAERSAERLGSSSDRDQIKVARRPGPGGSQNQSRIETGAAAIGAGLSSATEMHDFHMESALGLSGVNPIRIRQAMSRVFFEQINKVLMVGGFTTEGRKPFDSFSFSVASPEAALNRDPKRFNLRTLLSSETMYAVPDAFTISGARPLDLVVSSTLPATLTVGVVGQAELLRGLSRLAMSLRDWEPSAFDRILGNVNVADFVPDLPRESVDQKLFPKDLFYAAAVGNAGAILNNMTKFRSPVALIQPGRNMHWANEEDPSKDPTQQALRATMFDMVDGVRSTKSNTIDVARFLSAISEFLRATDGIENSKSDVLTTADENGLRPVDQIISARKDLKLLVMVLANFLSGEAIGSKGLVLPVFMRSEDNVALGMWGEPNLIDQAVVIRALLDASEVISAGLFRNAAIDLFSATTTAFFKPDLAFFSEKTDISAPLSLESVSTLLVAGERLSLHMSAERATQWRRISRPWINALRDASESIP